MTEIYLDFVGPEQRIALAAAKRAEDALAAGAANAARTAALAGLAKNFQTVADLNAYAAAQAAQLRAGDPATVKGDGTYTYNGMVFTRDGDSDGKVAMDAAAALPSEAAARVAGDNSLGARIDALPKLYSDGANGLYYRDTDGFRKPLSFGRVKTDIAIVVGQSNAEGRGTAALSPASLGYYIVGSTISYPLADAVGGAQTGSMWPSYENEWRAQTGRRLAVVEQATGTTSLLAVADTGAGNWSPTGALRAAAANAANLAIAAVNASPDHTLGSVQFIWCGGEQEGDVYNGSNFTQEDYSNGLIGLATYFKAQVPSMVEMLVVRTGSRRDRTLQAGWGLARGGQEVACAQSPLLRMVYRGAFSFPDDGLNIMTPGQQPHWAQAGYNLAGKCAARAASKSGEASVPAVPNIIGSVFFPDTNVTTATSVTQSITPPPGTKSIVIQVAAARPTSTSTGAPNTVTFDGVAAIKQFLFAAASTTPAGRNDVGTYYLNQTKFGATALAGRTANLAATTVAANNTLSLGVYYLDGEVTPSSAIGAALAASGTTLADSVTTGASCISFAVLSSAASSAAAITSSLDSGFTKDSDAGSAASGRASQAAFFHGPIGEVTNQAVTATFGAAVTSAALLVASYRGVIDGELG
jgi:hypothetical protein